ncbi:MAG: hypothetical protein D6773_15960, partial [Alphaproteobacteria bacterium]
MTSPRDPLRTLLLALVYPHRAAYYDDWLDSFHQSPAFDATTANLLELAPADLARSLDEHDLVILHHSCLADTIGELGPFSPVLAERRRARLVAFVGNEYNSPYVPMAEKRALLRACRPDIIATQLLLEAGLFLYEDLGAQVIALPHALNPAAYPRGPAPAARKTDIGVRYFRYSPLLGDEERNAIIDYFWRHGPDHGLVTDIDFEQRFSRDQWATFLRRCRGTVSSEAGSWYLDRDDALMRQVAAYVAANRSRLVLDDSAPLRGLVRRLPLPVKSAITWMLRHGPVKYAGMEDAKLDFGELYERFFKNAPRCPTYSKAISSRHFDAIGSGTCQIMLEGRFNDILTPGEHYLPVRQD